jgi:hypothetical protein
MSVSLNRLQWLINELHLGRSAHVSFSYNSVKHTEKVKFVLENAYNDHGCYRPCVLGALTAVRCACDCSISTDKGHRTSDGRTTVEFWLRQPNTCAYPSGINVPIPAEHLDAGTDTNSHILVTGDAGQTETSNDGMAASACAPPQDEQLATMRNMCDFGYSDCELQRMRTMFPDACDKVLALCATNVDIELKRQLFTETLADWVSMADGLDRMLQDTFVSLQAMPSTPTTCELEAELQSIRESLQSPWRGLYGDLSSKFDTILKQHQATTIKVRRLEVPLQQADEIDMAGASVERPTSFGASSSGPRSLSLPRAIEITDRLNSPKKKKSKKRQ